MTKAEIIKQIHQTTGLSREVVSQIVESFMETIKTDMKCGNNIYLRGFGSFVVKEYGEKRVYNINDGTYHTVPAHDVPTFKPGKEMHSQVSQEVKKKKK